ncbi:MAG: DUF6263 family protein [Candidatus Sumerlaeia bacterium]|nr:DUF6263 family protein [Candidatus Sumerlaeia bacterium]
MTRTATAFFAAATIVLAAAPLHAQEAYTHEIKLQKGDAFAVKRSQDLLIDQKMMGMTMKVTNQSNAVWSYSVLDVEADGTAQIQVTVLSMAMNLENPMIKIKFDSSAGAAPTTPEERMVQGFVGQTFFIRLSKAGEALDVVGAEAIPEAAFAAAQFPEANMMAPMLKAEFASAFTADSLKKFHTNYFGGYDGRQLKAGETWTVEEPSEQMNMHSLSKVTYTVAESTAGLLDVASSVTLSPDSNAPAGSMGGLTGTGSGVTQIHLASGLPVLTTGTGAFSSTVTTQGMTVGLNITSSERAELRPTAGALLGLLK